MKLALYVAVGVVSAFLVGTVQADNSRLFFSRSANAPTEVAGEETPSISVAQNAPVSLYIWWQPSGDDQVLGLGHDVQTTEDILEQVSYVIDNPTISGDQRWNDSPDAGTTSAGFLVDNAGAFNIAGSNFGLAGPEDPFFDEASGTYRLGVLRFRGTAAGSTELRIGVGDAGIALVDHPNDAPIRFGFGDLSVPGDDFGAVSEFADALVTVVAPDPTKPWLNPVLALDVDGSTFITPVDALIVINDLNDNSTRALAVPPAVDEEQPPFLDVDGDNFVKPLDALLVINFLNDQSNLTMATSLPVTLAAVPEPATDLLGLCGLGALFVMAARASRRRLLLAPVPIRR